MFYVVLWLPLADLPENLQSRIDAGSIRAIPSPNDCICLVKQYMGSEQLAQRPLLVLTEARAQRVGLVPSQKQLNISFLVFLGSVIRWGVISYVF